MTAGSPEEAAAPPAEAAEAPGTAERRRRDEGARQVRDRPHRRRAAGKLDPVLGRDDEIRQMVDILMRRRQNNPILTGEAGVGKTAVVEGLALRIAKGDVPPMLKDVRLMALDIGRMQAGASVRGEFETPAEAAHRRGPGLAQARHPVRRRGAHADRAPAGRRAPATPPT